MNQSYTGPRLSASTRTQSGRRSPASTPDRRIISSVTCALTCVLALGACSQLALAPQGDWHRSYARTLGEVWTAALEALEDEGFVIESADQDRGRIRAEAPGQNEYRRAVLHIQIRERDQSVLVDVAAGGGSETPGDIARFDRAVSTFLEVLDEYARNP